MKEIRCHGCSETCGYFEQWYFGDHEWQGIRVNEKGRLEYVEFIGEAQALFLGKQGFYGMTLQDKFYDQKSYLFNGVIMTYSRRRDLKDIDLSQLKQLGKIQINPNMPKLLVALISDSKEKIIERARKFHLSLENSSLDDSAINSVA